MTPELLKLLIDQGLEYEGPSEIIIRVRAAIAAAKS